MGTADRLPKLLLMHLVGVRSTPTVFAGKVNIIILFEKLLTI